MNTASANSEAGSEDFALLAEAIRRHKEGDGYRKISRAIGRSRDWVRHQLIKAKIRTPLAVVEIEPRTSAEYAERITVSWRKSVEAIFEVGRLLIKAKLSLPHGEFLAMVNGSSLPFGEDTAQRLMRIATDANLSNTAHARYLPPSWMTLYQLTRLDDEIFKACIADGTIRPDMERRDVALRAKSEHRRKREVALGAKIFALPKKRYGVILADPEWRFEPWSRATGMDRAADNHYPTSATAVIAARDVVSIAADDCVLFLWATAPMLPAAIEVMAAWGFEYKTNRVWCKDGAAGTGYWFRNCHEYVLVGTRGSIPAPAPGTQAESVIFAPRGAHSEKPQELYKVIEAYFPSLPKIELNARRVRAGWDVWGNEVPEISGTLL